MAIIHDDVGRRRFLSQAVMGFGVLFGMGFLSLRFVQFLVPSQKPKRYEPVLLGSETNIRANEAVAMDLSGHKILVLKTDEGVVAFSRRCTDLGCLVSWNKQREQFICPCHQGIASQAIRVGALGKKVRVLGRCHRIEFRPAPE